MFDILNLNPEAFGIDISDLSLKIAKLEHKRGKLRLVSCGETPIKSGIVKDGEIKNEKALVEIIKKGVAGVKGKKIKTKYIIASLPEEKAFLQVIQMPCLPEEDLKSAVIYEAENYIPLPIREVYLDSQIVYPPVNHLDHQDVLIAALPKKTIDPYLSCFQKAGLKPLVLEIESLAIARALVKSEFSSSPIVLIDFEAARTSFLVFSGRSLRFTSSIPISSLQFTESIARSLKIDLAKAEKLKLKYGLETRADTTGGEVFDALIPPLTDLTEQIKRHLDFYQSHSSHEHLSHSPSRELPRSGEISPVAVEKILLCGGGSNLKGLTDFLANELRVKVELGNPWVNISSANQKNKEPLLSSEESLRYTTALGLALRAVQKK